MTATFKRKLPRSALIVDDMPAMRAIIRTVLKSLGVKNIVEAGNGVQALQELQGSDRVIPKHYLENPELFCSVTWRPTDLIILDWIMPEMNGIEFLQLIQKIDRLKNIPVIMLTAEGHKENIIEAAECGVIGFIVKPFSVNVLHEKIKTVFEA